MSDDELTGYLSLAAEGAAISGRATKGPWTKESWLEILHVVLENDAKESNNPQLLIALMEWPVKQFEDDAAHIADARTRVPALAAALTATVGEVRRLQKLLDISNDEVMVRVNKTAETINQGLADENARLRAEFVAALAQKEEWQKAAVRERKAAWSDPPG